MNLGERIYKLRTEKNLSQGDLAERLDVSRQSISKWENNSSVPELEKIVKLSEIFEVSLDELVKGEGLPKRTESVTLIQQDVTEKTEQITAIQQEEPKVKEADFPLRKKVGTLLLCMAFMVQLVFFASGGWLGGLIFSLPFLTCGILCFILKQNVGLWCAWDVYVLFDIYMAYATGISRANVLYTFQWTPQMNYWRLAFAWIMLLSLLVMIAITVVRFGKKELVSEKKGRKQLIIVGLVLVALVAVMRLVRTGLYEVITENVNMFFVGAFYRVLIIVLSWSRIIAFTVALVVLVRFVRMKKQN